MKTAEEKLICAKIKLGQDALFHAATVYGMELKEDNNQPTMVTNGRVIKWNREFVDKLSVDEVEGVLLHEGMHTDLMDHIRICGRDPVLWNMACDYRINQMLVNERYELPPGLLDEQFRGMSAEEIYVALVQEREAEKQKDSDDSSDDSEGSDDSSDDSEGSDDSSDDSEGSGIPGRTPQTWGQVEEPTNEDGSPMSEGDITEEENRIKQMLAQAVSMAQGIGDKSGGQVRQMAEEMLEANPPWEEILAAAIQQAARSDYSYSRQNRRCAGMPGLYSQEIDKPLVVALDTSGSINRQLLGTFIGKLREFVAQYQFAKPVLLIHCDEKIQNVEELDMTTDVRPVGGGGTDFEPVFQYIASEQIDPAAVIYFTDMAGSFPSPDLDPLCPVVWLNWSSTGRLYDPPFGTRVDMV